MYQMHLLDRNKILWIYICALFWRTEEENAEQNALSTGCWFDLPPAISIYLHNDNRHTIPAALNFVPNRTHSVSTRAVSPTMGLDKPFEFRAVFFLNYSKKSRSNHNNLRELCISKTTSHTFQVKWHEIQMVLLAYYQWTFFQLLP